MSVTSIYAATIALTGLFWSIILVKLGHPPVFDLHSLTLITPRLGISWITYSLCGSALIAVMLLMPNKEPKTRITSQQLIKFLIPTAFIIPLAIRIFFLEKIPLTDDEAVYEFTAKLMADFKLSIPSYASPRAFDHIFLINDGRMFGQYFIGWSALLAIAISIGAQDMLAPMLSALTLIPLLLILRRHLSDSWVTAGLLIYCFSFLVSFMAATLLSHTACNFFILWFIFFSLRTADNSDNGAKFAIAAATCASIAFFIRPSTTLLACIPFIILMMSRMLNPRQESIRKNLVFFTITTAIFSIAFLASNKLTYGSYIETGYHQFFIFDKSHGFIFFNPESYQVNHRITESLTNPLETLRIFWSGVQRLSFDGLSWPIPSLLILCTIAAVFTDGRTYAVAALLLLAMHTLIKDLGIDSFGPTHLFEALPLMLASALIGANKIVKTLISSDVSKYLPNFLHTKSTPTLFAIATIVFALLTITPLRIYNLSIIKNNIAAPYDAAQALPGKNIIFTDYPFIDQSNIEPLKHYLYYPPINSPDLKDKTLWVNRRGVAEDNAILDQFPDRRAFYMEWRRNNLVTLIELDRADMKPGK